MFQEEQLKVAHCSDDSAMCYFLTGLADETLTVKLGEEARATFAEVLQKAKKVIDGQELLRTKTGRPEKQIDQKKLSQEKRKADSKSKDKGSSSSGSRTEITALNRFVSRSTDKCLPFFKVLRKKGPFEWTVECEQALEQLKNYLCSAPLLAKPLPGEKLHLYLAVSDSAVSSTLIKQEGARQSPVYYTSKAMTEPETRYPQTEKLAFALVTSARRLRPYFQAHTVIVLTNLPLKNIFLKLEISGRLMKWALELSEYDIQFGPRTALKGQAVANFIAELTPPSQLTESDLSWTIYVDGSSNERGCGAGILLLAPSGERFEYALRFNFRTSNNEAEYEALLACLCVARGLGAVHIKVFSDSQLVVNQIKEEYQTKDPRMEKYLSKVRSHLAQFRTYEVSQVPRSENSNADALAKLASAYETDLARSVPVEILDSPSILEPDVMEVDTPSPSWMDPIVEFIKGNPLQDPKEQKKMARRAARFTLREGALYRRGFSLPLLKCVTPEEGLYILREIHEGVCGNHSGARSLSAKAEALSHITESRVTSFIWANVVCRFGIPNAIVTDNGKQFDNAKFKDFCSNVGISHLSSSPAHPEANGQVEVVNKIIKRGLKLRLDSRKGRWAEELPEVLWSYRTTLRESTGETPFSLAFGSKAVVPVEIGIPTGRVEQYESAKNEEELLLNLDLLEEKGLSCA
ncbi:uncharacterized protein LOC111018362 [Momordica charantia]|uniref:Uncharacterized protein LOC111018362 n=1 Tax=Momordica charantia TaxID=3673 RepID=A0A6J1D7J6_MOMCH|nr:uncharacterized protein LOC111018362 [Momordica charantia]